MTEYVIRDYSQATELDPLVQGTVLRQLVLHGLVTALLVAVAVAMSW
jgi:hypothetical protein